MTARSALLVIAVLGLFASCQSMVCYANGKVSKNPSALETTRMITGTRWAKANHSTQGGKCMKSFLIAQAFSDDKGQVSRDELLEGMLRTAKSYFDEGNAQAAMHFRDNTEEYANARKEFIIPILNALRLLVENGITKDDNRPLVPYIEKFDMAIDSPERELALAANNEQIKARKIALLTNELISYRMLITRNIAGYYVQPPYAINELRQLASDTLKNDAVVQELIAEVEPSIAPANPIVTITSDPR